MTHAANPSHAQALVIIDELARCAVSEIVLAPGSRSAALAMAAHDDPRLRVHVEIDERSAGFLAVGIARTTGRPAAVVTTSGTAVANLHPAVVEADVGQVPLLVLTADRPPELRHTGANQTIDQPGIFGTAPRFAVDVGVAEDRPASVAYWRSTVCRAVAEAVGLYGPPGPVHLNLPFREPTVPLGDDGRSPPAAPFAQPLDGRRDGRPWTSVERGLRAPPAEVVDQLAARLDGVERGLVVVGQTTAPARPIHDLARAAGWPVLAEPTSNARFGPLAVACGHHLAAHQGFLRAHRPELVVRIGRVGLSRPVDVLLESVPEQILIDPHGTWHDPGRSVTEIVAADIAVTCAALTARLTASEAAKSWADRWLEADAAARRAADDVLDAEEAPTEPRTARDLGAVLPRGAALVVASSMPVRDLHQHLGPRDGLTVIANRGASGIDGTVSTVLGVALGHDGPTAALTGDLALLHDAGGFLLAADVGALDATFVVVDNDGGGIFSFLPQARFPDSFERVFGTPHGRDLADLARLYGLGYRGVQRASELVGAVEEMLGAGGLGLVHVRTNRDANLALHRRIAAEVSGVLDEMV